MLLGALITMLRRTYPRDPLFTTIAAKSGALWVTWGATALISECFSQHQSQCRAVVLCHDVPDGWDRKVPPFPAPLQRTSYYLSIMERIRDLPWLLIE